MDKKNVVIAGVIIVAMFVFIVCFGMDEIESMINMVYVSAEETIPEAQENHVVVLSSSGYDTENEHFRMIAGKLYVSMEYVNEQYAEGRFFFDQEEALVVYTNSTRVLNCNFSESYDLENGSKLSGGGSTFMFVPEKTEEPEESSSEESSEEEPIEEDDGEEENSEEEEEKPAGLPDGSVYISAEALSNLYGISFQYAPDTNVLTLQEDMMRYVQVQSAEEKAYLKVYAKKGSPFMTVFGKTDGYQVYRELTAGETLVCYGEEGDYYKVADLTGVVGYVEKSAVGDIQYKQKPSIKLDSYSLPQDKQLEEPISLIWQYFGAGNSYMSEGIKEAYAGTEGALTVIAPTWLHIWKDEDGNAMVENSINAEYIEWAHSAGYQVWVTLENVDNTFDDIDELQYELLSGTERRQALVQQILEWYQEYGFDGLNVDLEVIEERLGPYYVQFMRELSAVLRPAGCVLSTDVGVPTPWTEHYRRDVLGQVCDYVCLMGYDEHYSGDSQAGSVASYPWVQAGVQDSLTEGIPAEKLVLCMPLYTRIWYLNEKNEVLSDTRTLGMEEAWEEVTQERGIEPIWDQSVGQYYAEWVYGDGTRARTWLEDTRSMQLRIDLAKDQRLGGVALWFQGWDNEAVWDQIREYRESAN